MTQETKSVLIQFKGEATNLLQTQSKVTQETKKLANEFQKVGKANKNFGNQFQNIGYQIQDFAVQVGGGTDAMRAFSQQAPQLLSPLGNIGIAAATAVAVLVPLAKSFFDSGESAEKAAKQTNEMAESIKALISPSTGLSSLNKELAESESRFAGLATSLRNIALADSKKEIERLEEQISNLVSSLNQPQLGNNTISRYLALTAKGMSDVDAKFQATTENIQEIYGVSEEAAKSINKLSKQFADGLIDVEQFADAILALGVDPQTEGFAELLELLKKLAAEAQRLKDLSKIDIELNVRGDSLQEAIDAWDDYIEGLERLASSYKDSLDPLRGYYREIEKLGKLLEAELLTLEEYRALVARLRNELLQPVEVKVKPKDVKPAEKELEGIKAILSEIQTESERWADQFANQIVSSLAEGKLAFKDFANYVLQQLARIAISKALEPLFNSFGNWIGGITGAAAAPAGLVATPASAMPLSREMATVQPMVVGVPRMSAPTKSNSPVTVNVFNQGSNEVEVNERKTTRGIEIDVLIKNAVKKGIAAGDFDKVMATSYGARRLAF